MKKWSVDAKVEPIHPFIRIAKDHKLKLKMPAETIDTVIKRPGPFVSALKYDGEHTVIFWQRGQGDCTFVNSYGTYREDMPVSRELARILEASEFKSVVLAGELYAVYDDGSRMPLRIVMHHIKNPLNDQEANRVRMALFDVIKAEREGAGFDQLDGFPNKVEDYWNHLNIIEKILWDGKQKAPEGLRYNHIVLAMKGDAFTVKKMWDDEVIAKGMEGLVVHTLGGLVKVKTLSTMDVVIVGADRSGKSWPQGQVGSLLTAFMLPNGIFSISSNVTVSKPGEATAWYKWINEHARGELVIKGTPYVMCEPLRVMEVAANEWYAYDGAPTVLGLKYENSTWTKLGLYPGVMGQKPRFVPDEGGGLRERLDKGVNPVDLRLTQCPDFEEAWLAPYGGLDLDDAPEHLEVGPLPPIQPEFKEQHKIPIINLDEIIAYGGIYRKRGDVMVYPEDYNPKYQDAKVVKWYQSECTHEWGYDYDECKWVCRACGVASETRVDNPNDFDLPPEVEIKEVTDWQFIPANPTFEHNGNKFTMFGREYTYKKAAIDKAIGIILGGHDAIVVFLNTPELKSYYVYYSKKRGRPTEVGRI